jgi:hypothetical protein
MGKACIKPREFITMISRIANQFICNGWQRSTGIASTHYGKLGAKTLHKWAGIEDGRHLNEEILEKRFTH